MTTSRKRLRSAAPIWPRWDAPDAQNRPIRTATANQRLIIEATRNEAATRARLSGSAATLSDQSPKPLDVTDWARAAGGGDDLDGPHQCPLAGTDVPHRGYLCLSRQLRPTPARVRCAAGTLSSRLPTVWRGVVLSWHAVRPGGRMVSTLGRDEHQEEIKGRGSSGVKPSCPADHGGAGRQLQGLWPPGERMHRSEPIGSNPA
jgi:hypothetical protein